MHRDWIIHFWMIIGNSEEIGMKLKIPTVKWKWKQSLSELFGLANVVLKVKFIAKIWELSNILPTNTHLNS
jgi:hypothetical protein